MTKYIKQNSSYILFFLFLCGSSFYLKSQFADEWVNYNVEYYKIKIVSEGIYRITKQDLLDAGIQIGNINPKNIQIFHNGKEIPIYIKGENDFVFNDDDYIEFYGYCDNGIIDTTLYNESWQQANPYVSLINDTSIYFLTWDISPTPKLRYTVIDDTSNYQEVNSLIATKIISYNKTYYLGKNVADYTQGEGWFDSNAIYNNHPVSKFITLNNVDLTQTVKFEYCIVGAPSSNIFSNVFHQSIVEINGTQVNDTIFSGYNFIKNTVEVPADNNFELKFYATYNSSLIDRQTLAYIKTTYNITNNFNGADSSEFSVGIINQPKTLQILNFTSQSAPNILDPNNGYKYIPYNTSSNNYKITLQPGNYNTHLAFYSENKIKTPAKIEKAYFTNYFQNNKADLIIITNKKLKTAVEDYAQYRTSQGYNVLTVYIDELYNAFAYGIDKHPLAIINFLTKVYYNFSQLPKAIFIIGKSIHNRLAKNNPLLYKQNLVPSFGDPSSDNLLASKLDTVEPKLYPSIPIGRLSATNNEEVTLYLNKVIEYENTPRKEWMKQILHLGGGGDIYQQEQFENYLNDFAQIIEDTLFGGNVHTFIKNSSAPITTSISQSIKNLIDTGITLLTFFGHGSASGFDQNIDYPDNYENYQRYPFILSNSCLTGDIHLPEPKKLCEQWIFAEQKGAIGFFASADLGYTNMLYLFSKEFYKQISYANYGKPIGFQIQQTIKNFLQNNENNPYFLKTAYDFTLHGDPLIKLYHSDKPELLIHQYNIDISPETIDLEADSFLVNLIVTNIGKATTDTFVTQITRNIDETQFHYFTLHNGCYYKDTVQIFMPSRPNNLTGLNSICFYTDQLNQIDEYNENNNETCISFLVTSDYVYPIFPYEFAIYPYDTVTLKAYTDNPLFFEGDVIFQIDTNDYFTSPFMQQHITTIQPGGVVKWTLPFTLQDSVVYYWRVSKLNSDNWKESSFTYIKNKTGWSQAHFYQFKKNNFEFINFDRPNRKFSFSNTPIDLFCRNIGTAQSYSFYDIKYYIGNYGDYSCCGASDAIIVAVFDSLFLKPWTSDRGQYGHRDFPNCPSRERPDNYFVFSTDSVSLVNMANFVFDTVPNNNYILLYSWRNGNFQNWPESAYQKLEALGAQGIRLVPNNYPYIFFTKKGEPNSSIIIVGDSPTDTITLYSTLTTNASYGKITSTVIGPVINLYSVHWRYKELENTQNDSTIFSFEKILSQNDSLIFYSQTSIDTILSLNYGYYYQTNMFTSDSTNKTPSQPKRWQIIYDEAPETAINPNAGFWFTHDSVQQGDTIYFAIATENISQKDMDSLVVRYYLTDENNFTTVFLQKKLRTHPAADIIIDTIAIPTNNLLGEYTLRTEYNPINFATGKPYQPEQYHFNNIIDVKFTVYPDEINPILDVTFDGRHIMNCETVANNPQILISLTDENDNLLLNDTSVFEIYLSELKTDTVIRQQIFFSNSNNNYTLEFFPAPQFGKNRCQALFKPILTPGKYKLEVNGKDITGNNSGNNFYSVCFIVDSTISIEHFFCYPNPFSDKTHFAFILKHTVPDEFYINIYNINGQFIKKLNFKNENLYVGFNISNIYWDGKDANNKIVLPGIYIFKVFAKYNNIDIPVKVSTYDNASIKGFGKIIFTGK